MKIHVIKNNLPLGVLDENLGKIAFTYENDVNKKRYVKGLKEKVNESHTLFPIFGNMLPEHEQLKLLKSEHKLNNQIEVLLYLTDIHGSYEFYTEEDFSNLVLKKQEIFIYNDAKKEILANDYVYPNIIKGYSLNISDEVLYPTELVNSRVIGLSGFQYKFSVVKDDINKTIKYDETQNSNYFMKPYNTYYTKHIPKDKNRSYIPYLLINEHIFMTLARDFGFDVPYNGIIKHKTDYHYIIKRFDRFNDSKIDHEEILTIMNKSSDQKYRVSMRDAVNTVKELIDEESLIDLFKFIVFSIIIGHGDLHAKNLSLIYSSNNPNETKMHVSPYYDISTTKIYKDTKENDIGLKIGNRLKRIKKEHIVEFAKLIGIEKAVAIKIIDEMSMKFLKNFKNYISLLPSEIRILPYYINSFGKQSPLEIILDKYFIDRSSYINGFLLDCPYKKEDDIWDL